MKATSNSITSLPPSPSDDRHSRMVKYAVAMGVRLVCLILCFVVPLGWWTVFPVIGAVVLPYFAVVLANVGHESGDAVTSPGAVQVYRAPDATPFTPDPVPDGPGSPTVGGDPR